MPRMAAKKRGRKPEENPLLNQVSVRLTDAQAARLDQYRNQFRPPPRRADVMRLALDDFLDAAEMPKDDDKD
jgi:hypothetical protein